MRTDPNNELITPGSANGGSVGYARGSDGMYVRSQRIHGSLDSIGEQTRSAISTVSAFLVKVPLNFS